MSNTASSKSKTNKTNGNLNTTMADVYRRAFLHFRDGARGDTPLAQERMFTAFLFGVESHQTYRYLRKVLRAELGNQELYSFEELAGEFSTEAVSKRVAGRPLEEAGTVFQLWGNAARELTDAFEAFKGEMGDGRQDTTGEPDGSRVPGTGDGAEAGVHDRASGGVPDGEGRDADEVGKVREAGDENSSGVAVPAKRAPRRGRGSVSGKGGAA